MLREQAMKVERQDKELRKYREKLNEMEFFKARVEVVVGAIDTFIEISYTISW